MKPRQCQSLCRSVYNYERNGIESMRGERGEGRGERGERRGERGEGRGEGGDGWIELEVEDKRDNSLSV